jgi:hypothetical protein
MTPQLKTLLLKSPTVRRAFRKEVFGLMRWLIGYVVAIAAFRYFTDRPLREGILSALVGAAAVILIWCLSVTKTIRSVLHEHALDEERR